MISRSVVKMMATAVASALLGAFIGIVIAPEVSALYERVVSKAGRVWAGLSEAEDKAPTAEWRSSPAFEQTVHARGFSYPTRLAFHPRSPKGPQDPFYYVAELAGTIKIVTTGGEVRTLVEGLLNFEWTPMEELGLLGLDIGAAGEDMYITLAYWDEAGGVYRNRVDRLRLAADGLSVSERTTLLDIADEPTVASYQIQFVKVGPHGAVFVGVGSGGVKTDAQDPDKFAGKILRMDRDGNALPDNPFYEPERPRSARSFTYALGFRNPFDLEWDPDSGVAVVSDVGPGTDRIVRLDRGVNYCFSGGPDGDETMRANALFSWGPGGSYAPTGLAIAGETVFEQWQRKRLFVALFGAVHMPGSGRGGKKVLAFDFSPAGYLESGPHVVTEYTGKYYSAITDVEAGPDAVYGAEIYGPGELPHRGNAVIYRIEATGKGELKDVPSEGAGPRSGEQLFVELGCIACHDMGTSQSNKEGPPLGDLADRLDERLNASSYDALLADLQNREGGHFESNRALYQELQALDGEERVEAWFEARLKNPRFDDTSAKMPAFAHLTPAQVDALKEYLLD